jgi:hypothetical protein
MIGKLIGSAGFLSSGGTIGGDLTIDGDLTVNGDGSYAYSEVLTGDMKITNSNDGAFVEALTLENDEVAGGSATGVLFKAGDSGDGAKGGITYSKTASYGRGSISFLQNTDTDNTAAGLSDAVMTILTDGSVGIGTNDPDANMHIFKASAGSISAHSDAVLAVENSGNTAITILSGNGSHGQIHFGDDGQNDDGVLGYDQTSNKFYVLTNHSTTKKLVVDANGKVGINSATPTHGKVEIIGDSDAFQLVMSDVADDDDTIKEARIGMMHYKQAEEPVTLMFAQSAGAGNTIYIGGGTGSGNHATSVAIATASTYNSTSTTTNMIVDNDSRISLSNNDDGTSNTIFGKSAGATLDAGSNYNVFIGHQVAGENTLNNATQNTMVGYRTGYGLTSGDSNTMMGRQAGLEIEDGHNNTLIGMNAGAGTVLGGYLVAVGDAAMGSGVVTAAADGAVAVGASALNALTSGAGSTAVGYTAGQSVTTGENNTALGYGSMGEATGNAITGGDNTCVGFKAGFELSGSASHNTLVGTLTGWNLEGVNGNTAVGRYALQTTTSAVDCVAIGKLAMNSGTATQAGTVAIGTSALTALADGAGNTAVGYNSGVALTTGERNTILGYGALDAASTEADDNVAIGYDALGGGIGTGAVIKCVAIGNYAMDAAVGVGASGSVAIGYSALGAIESGEFNTAVGFESLKTENQGDKNTAIGYQALTTQDTASNVGENTAVGYQSGDVITTGVQNTIIGAGSDPSANSGTNQTVVGYATTGVADNSVTLGNASVTDVYMSQDSGAYVHSQNVPNHVANTMSSPYYRFDGVDDKVEVADNANLDFATNDFTTEALVRIPSVGANKTILGKIDHTNSALEGYSMEVGANDKLAGRIVGNNTRVLIAESSKTIADGLWHHVCITFDRSASATVYVDGVADGTTTISGASGDASNSYPFQIGTNDQESNFAEMEVNHARVFNNLLTATEVKELYSGASVPFKYKGANQTALITGDNSTFASGLGDWVSGSNWNSQTNPSNNMVLTANASDQRCYLSPAQANLEIGKRYRFVYDATSITGTVTLIAWTGAYTTLGTFEAGTGKSIEFTAPYGLDTIGIGVKATSSGDAITLDNLFLTQIGAVAEYDGSGVASDKWFDKSGNDLHGTVTGASVENAPSGEDDGLVYETGTWDGVISDGTTPMTMNGSADTGYYTRVGNLVTVTGFFATTDLQGLSSETIRLTGLPFTIANDNAAYFGGGARCDGLAITAGHSVNYHGQINTTYINLNVWDATTGASAMTASEWSADGNIMISVSYRVA